MKISEFKFDALSQLKYLIFVCEFGGKWNPSALVLEFSGKYGLGSEGNTDADYIDAIKAAALAILNVEAVVFDFRNMSYEWGNRIWNVLQVNRPDDESGGLPVAMVISDKCCKGFSS